MGRRSATPPTPVRPHTSPTTPDWRPTTRHLVISRGVCTRLPVTSAFFDADRKRTKNTNTPAWARENGWTSFAPRVGACGAGAGTLAVSGRVTVLGRHQRIVLSRPVAPGEHNKRRAHRFAGAIGLPLLPPLLPPRRGGRPPRQNFAETPARLNTRSAARTAATRTAQSAVRAPRLPADLCGGLAPHTPRRRAARLAGSGARRALRGDRPSPGGGEGAWKEC